MNIKLTNEEVLVQVLESAPFVGSLYIPKTARQPLQAGLVLQNNTDLPLEEGDVVWFQNYRGRPFPPMDGKERLWLLRKDDLEVKVVKE